MLNLIGLLVILILIACIVIDFLQSYAKAAGNLWQRLLAAGKGSATVLWARFLTLLSSATAALVWLADWLNAPGVADGIRAVLAPQWVVLFGIAVGLVTELARRRSLGAVAAVAAVAARPAPGDAA